MPAVSVTAPQVSTGSRVGLAAARFAGAFGATLSYVNDLDSEATDALPALSTAFTVYW